MYDQKKEKNGESELQQKWLTLANQDNDIKTIVVVVVVVVVVAIFQTNFSHPLSYAKFPRGHSLFNKGGFH